VVPRELQLLLPLLLTVIEAMLLLPQRSHNIIPWGLQLATHIMSTAELADGAAPAKITATAAHTDALVGPVLLQLGPAVMQYIRQANAAAAGGHGSASGGESVDWKHVASRVQWDYTAMVTVLDAGAKGDWHYHALRADDVCICQARGLVVSMLLRF
jgi:hypothetical protein